MKVLFSRGAWRAVRGAVSTHKATAVWIVLGLALVVGLPMLWRWTPLSEWASVENGAAWFSRVRSSEVVALWVMLLYVIGALLFLPINLFIFLTALFFDDLAAAIYVALGVGLNAATGYAIGRYGGGFFLRRIGSARIERISTRLSGCDTLELFLFRLIPVTPFSTVNVVCGALRIPAPRFFAATFASIAPGATLIVLFERALMAFARDMSWRSGLALAAAIGVLVAAAFWLKRRALR